MANQENLIEELKFQLTVSQANEAELESTIQIEKFHTSQAALRADINNERLQAKVDALTEMTNREMKIWLTEEIDNKYGHAGDFGDDGYRYDDADFIGWEVDGMIHLDPYFLQESDY